MSLFDEITNQIKTQTNEDAENIPWTHSQDSLKIKDKPHRYDTKKLAKIGLTVLILIIIAICLFKYFSNKSTNNVETSTKTEENQKNMQEIQIHVAGDKK